MAISPLPAPPNRADPINFAVRGDALLSALPVFVTEANALQTDVNSKQQATTDAAAAGALSASAALNSKNTAGSSEQAAQASKVAAAASEANAIANANTAGAANTSAQGALAGTTSAAAQAANYRDQAITASQVATAANEALAAISQSLHYGAVVKLFPYFPFNDSDGGAWTDKCTDKSWENEPLCPGTWRQQRTNLAAAWAITGAVAGDYYQSTTDGKFYMIGGLIGAQTQTEVFRGGRRKFPRGGVAIIAETGRVIIYDTSAAGCPMWLVFITSPADSFSGFLAHQSAQVSAISAVNGSILVGKGANFGVGYYGHLRIANFAADTMQKWNGFYNNHYNSSAGIYQRNTNYVGFSIAQETGRTVPIGIIDGRINDIAVTVLDSSPIDPATGMKVPTIVVATAGGVSVIKDDGTIVNSTVNSWPIDGLSFIGAELVGARKGAIGYVLNYGDVRSMVTGTLLSRNYTTSSVPALKDGNAWRTAKTVGAIAAGGVLGLQYIKENPAFVTKGMVSETTPSYSTGWQVGDSRLATLADTVAETITGSGELFDYSVGPLGTTGGGRGTAENLGNGFYKFTTTEIVNTNNGYYVSSIDPILIMGKTYVASMAITEISGGTTVGLARSTLQNAGLLANFIASTGVGLVNASFTQDSVHDTISFRCFTTQIGSYVIAKVSLKMAEPDRSVKNKGLILNGTLTKRKVDYVDVNNQGTAGLVAYSGFSASNYLEQPYNSDLDFGTGDFCVMGWANLTSLANQACLLRGFSANPCVGIATNSGTWWPYCSINATGIATGIAATLGLHFLLWKRDNSIVSLYVDGVMVYTATNTANVSSNTATTFTGNNFAYSSPFQGSLALWRISATAPSQQQIECIYRTELALFQPNAQCTIDGTSSAITAMAYDDSTDLLQVGTSWGRSAFKDLVRVESEVSAIGAITSIAAGNGAVSVASATSARIYQPSLRFRDELRRQVEAARALGKVPVFFEFDTISFTGTTANASNSLTAVSVTTGAPYVGMGITGTGIPAGTTITAINGNVYTLSAAATAAGTAVVMGQASFNLPKGYTAKAVYAAEARKREGATKTWTRAFDGFVETINFGTSPGNAVWVSIMAIRSN
jgi:hypothetical protein